MLDDKGGFCLSAESFVDSQNPKPDIALRSIASCPKCDLDVCGLCAQWRMNQGLSEFTADGFLASLQARVIACRQQYCPRCSGGLVSKTSCDLARLKEHWGRIATLAPPEAKKLAHRLCRIFDDEAPVLLRVLGEEKFQKMHKALRDLTGLRKQGVQYDAELSPSQRLTLAQSLIVDSKEKRTDIIGYLKDLKAIDSNFNRRAAKYPEVERLAHVMELESSVDFTRAAAERDQLIEELKEVSDTEALRSIVLNALLFKAGKLKSYEFHRFLLEQGSAARIDLGTYRNVERLAEYEALMREAATSDLAAGLSNFEADLIKELQFRTSHSLQ